MTPDVTVVWTLLPDPAAPRADDGSASLSLVFGFQLTGTATVRADAAALTLQDFPRVRTWPDLAFTLDVTFREEATGKTTSRAGVVEPIPRPALWSALLPSSTPVTPYLFDEAVTTDPVQSYPVQEVAGSLREQYGRLFAAEADAPEAPASVAPRARAVRRADWQAVDALVRTVGARDGGTAARAADADPFAAMLRRGVLADEAREDPLGWLRVADFHEPFAEPLALGGTATPSGAGPPDRDFHGILAALGEHPGLMSLIGLVRRVKVPLPAELDGAVAIQAHPETLALLHNDLPFTRCVVREGRLFLADRDGTRAALHLPLDDADRYAAHTVDVDAAALALRSYADMLAGLPRTEPPPVLLAPALRSDGVFVAEKDRQVGFRTVLKESKALNDDLQKATEPGKNITLHAGRVLQGYRVDVFDETSGRWYPLCRRTGHYTVRGVAEQVPVDDEGSVADALTRGKDAQDNRVSRLHQSLFRWNGWSLVAEPPGKMLDEAEQLAEPGPAIDPGLPFSSILRPADGTLPSLRYGRSYRFRARLVDLAGRSLPFTDRPTPGEPATAPLLYTRYEPVPAPVLVPRRRVTPGESLTVLVVRTDNADPDAPAPGPTCERHLLAPKAAVQMLERHGVLDVVGEHRLDPAVHALLSRLDGGEVTGPRDPGAGGTPYVDTDAMSLPWPPDPFSRGAAFLGLPQTSELLAPWPHGNGWHERLPVRFVVVAGGSGPTPPPVFDPAGRLIRVTLPPAADVTSRLSSMLTSGDEELLGLWHWFAGTEGRTAEELDDARARAVAGHVAQLTPTTTLRLIHAVRCPVEPPAFGRPGIERAQAETAYVLDDPALTVHGPSTLSVHVEAMWNEIADDPARSTPAHSTGRAVLHPGEDGIRSAADGPGSAASAAVSPFRSRHDMGDTRHRAVRFTPVGTSSFIPYFTQRRTVRLTALDEVPVATSFVPGTVVVRAAVEPLTAAGTPAEPGMTYTLDRDYTVSHDTGRVARAAGGAIADGDDVEVSFVVPPVTRAGSPVTLHVPATVRPPAPAVHSVVPAFAWKDESTGGTRVSVRQGGVVRVYLQRPWYESGEGELLAVRVLGQDAPPDATSREWATMWGRDPVRQAGEAPPTGFPRPSDLLDAVDVRTSSGHAMGYPVSYDEQRQLWYADVRFQAQRVYQPFVRLRCARLQPDALLAPEDLRLSPGVDAGFVQIPAHRKASVTVSAGLTEASVTVTGPLPPTALGNFTTTMIVGRQLLGSASVDDPAQWRTVGTPGTTFPTGVALPLVEVTGPLARWTGTVPLASAPPGPGRQRLLVMEVDEVKSPRGLSRRVSYLDTFTI